MLTAAIVLWRRPAISVGVLAAAAWFKLAPAVLIPVWLAPLRGRRLAAALCSLVVVSLPLLGLLLAMDGLHGPVAMVHALSFQFSRGSPMSLWSVPGAKVLQPLMQGCVLGLIAGSVVRLRNDPELAQDRTRMAALAATILIGLQLAADYWAFLYLVWVLPLLCMSLLESGVPSLSSVRPPTGAARIGWTPLDGRPRRPEIWTAKDPAQLPPPIGRSQGRAWDTDHARAS
jgi:hypothetical protein